MDNNEDIASEDDNDQDELLSAIKDKEKTNFSSNKEVHTDTTNLMRYLDKHAYETLAYGKNNLEVKVVFDSTAYFRRVLNDVMIRGEFDIEKIYNDKKV